MTMFFRRELPHFYGFNAGKILLWGNGDKRSASGVRDSPPYVPCCIMAD